MAHANNAVYVDWLEEAIRLRGGETVLSTFPRTYRLEYLASAAPDQELLAEAWPDDEAYSTAISVMTTPIAQTPASRPRRARSVRFTCRA